MTYPRLAMRNVAKRFGATVALAGVDLEVAPGEVHALVGENGAGKSTLMKVLSGAIRPDRGVMELDGERYEPRSPGDGRAAGVAMIYQELSLAQHLSIAENILLGVEPRVGPFVRWGSLRDRAAEAMRRVGRGDLPLDTRVGRLSVAEQQLVEIARSVAVGCRVLVLDEPTSSLAAGDIDRLFTLIRQLKAEGVSVVYISHFLEEVRHISDRFTVLRDGHTVGSGVTADAPTPDIIGLMVGRNVSNLYPRTARTPGDVILELDDVAGVTKPRHASLRLRRGEVLGVAGLIGAGRTEMLRAVFALDTVKRGRVRVQGIVSRADAMPADRWKRGVGMVSEDRKREGLALNLSIAENLTLPSLRAIVTPDRQRRAARAWIGRLGVKAAGPSQTVGALSGGNQQKVAIARLLHADADVLLLDEPTRGIDVGSKAEIYRLIDELARRGKAILMVSSYLPELLGVCDRVAVMHRGKLGPARDVRDLTEHAIMLEATGAA